MENIDQRGRGRCAKGTPKICLISLSILKNITELLSDSLSNMDPRDAGTSKNIDVYDVPTLAKDFFGQSFLNTTKPVARAYFRELRSIFKKLPRHNPRVLFLHSNVLYIRAQ